MQQNQINLFLFDVPCINQLDARFYYICIYIGTMEILLEFQDVRLSSKLSVSGYCSLGLVTLWNNPQLWAINDVEEAKNHLSMRGDAYCWHGCVCAAYWNSKTWSHLGKGAPDLSP